MQPRVLPYDASLCRPALTCHVFPPLPASHLLLLVPSCPGHATDYPAGHSRGAALSLARRDAVLTAVYAS